MRLPKADTTIEERRGWVPLLLLCAAQFAVVLTFQVSSIVLPAIGAAFDMSAGQRSWVVTAHALAFGGCLLLGGRLADVYGARRALLAGLALFAATSVCCAAAVTPGQLIAARAGQGVATALAAPATLALIVAGAPEGRERTRALGLWSAAGPLGGAAGVALGGWLATAVGWRPVFLLGVPFALLPLLFAAHLPNDTPRGGGRRRGFDVVGAATGTAAMVALVYGFAAAADDGFAAPRALVALAGSIAVGALFLYVERRARDPLLPLRLLRRSPAAGANLVSFVHAAATNTPIVFFALYLQGVEGWNVFATGLAFLPCNAAIVAASPFAARLTAAAGARVTTVAGLSTIAVGLLLMARLESGGYAGALLPGLVVMGLGHALTQVGVVAAGTTDARLPGGLAAGLLNTTAQIGTAVGLAVLVTIAAAANEVASGYRWAFLAGALLALGGAVLAAAVVERKGHRRLHRTHAACHARPRHA